MKEYQYITNEMMSGEYLRYRVKAASFQEACWKMAKMGLLKGHMLRNFSGKWIPVEVFTTVQDCPGMWTAMEKETSLGTFLVGYAEDYWQPDSIQAFRQENGLYTIRFTSRNLESSIETNLSLYEAFKMLKAYCIFNKIQFTGFKQ